MRAAATFGRNPGDDLVGIGDVASLAVDAVGGVDLQVCAGTIGVGFHFVNCRGAEILAGVAVFNRAAMVADIEVGNLQVAGLIFLMMGAGMKDVRDFIKGQLAVRFDLGEESSRTLAPGAACARGRELPHSERAGRGRR